MSKLIKVLELVEVALDEYGSTVEVVEHYSGDEKEYLSIRIAIEHRNAVAMIREYIYEGVVVAYGYYFRVGEHEEWWDNRPHHQEMLTHPNHKHVGKRVEPLENPSVEAFVHRLKRFLRK